jgi:hypothetical protein
VADVPIELSLNLPQGKTLSAIQNLAVSRAKRMSMIKLDLRMHDND